MTLRNIDTDRLLLMPVTLEIVKSLMVGSNDELLKLQINPNTKWPTKDTKDILPIINRTLEKNKVPSGFETWMIIKKDNMQVIGDIGFHSEPNEKGEVEVGYCLVEDERGKGFGFEALSAIMDWIHFQKNVSIVKAQCLIENKPSARILQKVGMKEIDRDMDSIYWEFIKPVS
ncbi:RimJ/RimL family protein N-acetyltransferase [Clostridium acetobutylicum]|uniref:Acetyltransferase (Ribosomal protein N-acetylase subfamily) n=1 Tax=Clostridium acetobutylicum (strain ATCC 824 / DSM 792 / JCM 1419 / IAM 19013 / LMG 5710 / NBRC 13948 / NRRL B-527 / VKM B-1787 / 2291 / W) TaxID=272562 RepID=Q97DP9_CLOAB|nr:MULTISPECIES: GNAT family protein [Clostridium]AAK81353.1 Acetyltransferase (ribosomal protein N-acetylase subfamily) [Clostridium acetobutylicum ATCC 824]ADZ22464.1 Acetyltransferase (ribosomal protein N-acetylase subfamily) [Clostridium acetobutylicum EA 2018]AEI33090.1 acetyltransferase [Clostridium acetobutylicum DSM 1731]AWV80979.1 N-acetyltransferase [Clostridium acetobutylicum]KHD36667.1 acetyltransferase [Clostridium acetobutylicum]